MVWVEFALGFLGGVWFFLAGVPVFLVFFGGVWCFLGGWEFRFFKGVQVLGNYAWSYLSGLCLFFNAEINEF